MEPAILIISSDAEVRDSVPWFAASGGLGTEILDVGTHGVERLQYGALPLAVLIDLELTGVPAQAVLRAVARRYPDLTVLMVGDDVSEADAGALLGLGASSVVSRRGLGSEMSQILETLAKRPPARPPFRAHRRVALRLTVEIGTDDAFETYQTRDLSLSGMFVPMADPPAAGSGIKGRLRPPDADVIELTGEVARRLESAGNTGIAVRFVDLSETARGRLASLIGQVARTPPEEDAPPADPGVTISITADWEDDELAPPEQAKPTTFNLDDLLSDAQERATADAPVSALLESAAIAGGAAAAEANVALGERLLRIGSFALAQKRFEKALAHDPTSNRIQFLYALAGAREAVRTNQPQQARMHYLQVLALDPDCVEAIEATRSVGGTPTEKKKGVLRKLFSRS